MLLVISIIHYGNAYYSNSYYHLLISSQYYSLLASRARTASERVGISRSTRVAAGPGTFPLNFFRCLPRV